MEVLTFRGFHAKLKLSFSTPVENFVEISPLSHVINEMDTWQQVLDIVEKKINQQSYNTWFKPTQLHQARRQGALRSGSERVLSGLVERSHRRRPRSRTSCGHRRHQCRLHHRKGPSRTLDSTVTRPVSISSRSTTRSTRSTPSILSSSAHRISLRTRRLWPSPKNRRKPITRCSFMAVWVWERRT